MVDRALLWEEERESMGEAEEECNSSRMSKKHRIGGQCIEREGRKESRMLAYEDLHFASIGG